MTLPKGKIYIIHILFWLAIWALWYYFRYEDYYSFAEALLVTFLKVFFLALIVYFANLLLIPTLLYQKKYVLFGLSYILSIIIISFLKIYLEGKILYGNAFNIFFDIKGRIYDNTIPHFLLVSTGIAFKLLFDHAKAQEKLVQITREKAQSELHFLRGQMNPHFLFNSINAIYFLIDKNNLPARDALHKFAEMLRFQLYDCNGDKIKLSKEIQFIKDYIALQRLRFNENTEIELKADIAEDFFIEPLLLLPFVENACKHVALQFSSNFICISIVSFKNKLLFTAENTAAETVTQANSKGIGIVNVKKGLSYCIRESIL